MHKEKWVTYYIYIYIYIYISYVFLLQKYIYIYISKITCKCKWINKFYYSKYIIQSLPLDQSLNFLIKEVFSWNSKSSCSSKVQLCCSLHNIHIKQKGAKFNIPDEHLQNQLRQPTSKSNIFGTHWTMKSPNT